MFKPILYFIVLFAVAGGILFWIGKPKGNNMSGEQLVAITRTNGSVLTAEETFFDFGNISMAAGVVAHDFKIQNSGSSEILIDQIYTSCMCTSASLIKGDEKKGPFGMPGHGFVPKVGSKLGAREEAVIKVEFDPTAHGPAGVGPVDRAVYIFQKDTEKPVELKFKALVTP